LTLQEWEWSALHQGHITLKEITLGTHLIESWMGLEAGLDFVAKRKINQLGNNVNHSINICGGLYRTHVYSVWIEGSNTHDAHKILFQTVF
jgi:hypothetical protein